MQDRAQFLRNKLALPGAEREGGPTAAAEAAYAIRAAGGAYVPFALTRNAHRAWANAKARAAAKGPQAPGAGGTWTLAGPSSENFPDVLTFSGAAYTTSGRITALAIDPSCSQTRCRVWAAAAGGGVWRTDNALQGSGVRWTFVSGSFATNAIGTLTYDAAHNTLYAGTGEPNASGDSEAGFGIYKSNDGGNTWTQLASNTSVPAGFGCGLRLRYLGSGGFQIAPAYSGPAFDGRSISSIDLDPSNANIMYVSSARGVRGISSVSRWSREPRSRSSAVRNMEVNGWRSKLHALELPRCLPEPNAPGQRRNYSGKLWLNAWRSSRLRSTPASSSIVYAAPFPQNNALPLNTKGGVWRSTDSGANWTQIKNALNAAQNTDRASFAVTPIAGGFTRMYVGVGNASIAACPTCDGGSNQARLYRTDDAVNATNASFTDLTALQQASAAPNQTINYCGDPAVGGAQCWYDNVVYSPPGKPDVVYLGGSYNYTQYGFSNNGRAFIRSANAGVTFTDMTWDATTNPTPPDTLLPAESGCAEWSTSGQSRDCRNPGDKLGNFRHRRRPDAIEWRVCRHLIPVHDLPRPQRPEPCNLPAIALRGSDVPLQS